MSSGWKKNAKPGAIIKFVFPKLKIEYDVMTNNDII